MRNYPSKILSASNASSQTGAAILCDQYVQASFQVVFADGVAAGSVKLQASNDGFTFTDVPSATVTVTAGNSGLIPKLDLCYQFIRAVFTVSTPGSTLVTVIMTATAV